MEDIKKIITKYKYIIVTYYFNFEQNKNKKNRYFINIKNV